MAAVCSLATPTVDCSRVFTFMELSIERHFVCSRNFYDHYQMMDGRTSLTDQNSLLRPDRGLNNCIIVFIMMRFYANLNNRESW